MELGLVAPDEAHALAWRIVNAIEADTDALWVVEDEWTLRTQAVRDLTLAGYVARRITEALSA